MDDAFGWFGRQGSRFPGFRRTGGAIAERAEFFGHMGLVRISKGLREGGKVVSPPLVHALEEAPEPYQPGRLFGGEAHMSHETTLQGPWGEAEVLAECFDGTDALVCFHGSSGIANGWILNEGFVTADQFFKEASAGRKGRGVEETFGQSFGRDVPEMVDLDIATEQVCGLDVH